MAGGSGTRLWPLSRRQYPKQFLPLTDARSLFQLTVLRAMVLGDCKPIVICNEQHRFVVAEQLRQLACRAEIILEPQGRNTAPAICLAALRAMTSDDGMLMVLAADHDIQDSAALVHAAARAVPLANAGYLVTFGTVASQPETGYGYVQRGDSLAGGMGFAIRRFVEKPDRKTAQQYVASGEYLWNSGMFMFRACRYLEELSEFAPEIVETCGKAMAAAVSGPDFLLPDEPLFACCPDDSIDYAVMEKTRWGAVVPMDAGWSDVGSWSSLWALQQKDQHDNVLQGDVIAHDTRASLVHASSKLVCTLGLEGVVVIETDDAVLVAAREQVQNVKALVAILGQQQRIEH